MDCRVFCQTDIVQEIEGVPDEGYAPFFFSGDGSTLPFRFTDQSFTRVLSALANGAYLTYGDEGRQVVWDFLVNVEFPMPFCAQVIECIESDGDTQAAIVNMLSENAAFQELMKGTVNRLTEGQITLPITTGICGDSQLTGEIVAIVEKLNARNVDFLEIVEVGTNDEEKIASILEAIPILDELPVGDAIDFLQDILEDFSENYVAAVTDDWKDSVEKGLYCLAKNNLDCILTFQDIFSYFMGRAGNGLTIGSFLSNFIDWVRTGDFSTDDLVASGLYAFQLGMILNGREFNGMKVPTMGAITRDASPSSKWEEWGDCPSFWSHLFPDDNVWSLWTLESLAGETSTIEDSQIVAGQTMSGPYDVLFMKASITLDATVTSFSYTLIWNSTNILVQRAYIWLDGVDVGNIVLGNSGEETVSWAGEVSGSHTWSIVIGVYGTKPTDYINVFAAQFAGTGESPFA